MKRIAFAIFMLLTAPQVLAHEDHSMGMLQHALHHMGQLPYLQLAGVIALIAVVAYGIKRYYGSAGRQYRADRKTEH
jgi:hypothetical protein